MKTISWMPDIKDHVKTLPSRDQVELIKEIVKLGPEDGLPLEGIPRAKRYKTAGGHWVLYMIFPLHVMLILAIVDDGRSLSRANLNIAQRIEYIRRETDQEIKKLEMLQSG